LFVVSNTSTPDGTVTPLRAAAVIKNNSELAMFDGLTLERNPCIALILSIIFFLLTV